MTRSMLLLSLLSSFLLAQQPWQGEIKQLYKLDVPSYQGNALVYGKVEKGGNLPSTVEMYSIVLKPTDLKIPAGFYRSTLEKQGFKAVNNISIPTLEKIEMVHAARKLTAVVIAQKQTAEKMMIGVTVMPEGTIAKVNAKK
jgi:hypothetical protein